MTIKAGVAAIPVSAFYKNGKEDKVLRFCFAKKESTLEEAVNRLIKFQSEFQAADKALIRLKMRIFTLFFISDIKTYSYETFGKDYRTK